jgi:(2Fe-2S) ferredoxin
MKLIVCTMQRHAPNPHSCGNGGALEIAAKLERELTEAEIFVTLERIGCFGACLKGPNVQLLPEGKMWHEVDIETVEEIVDHIKHMSSKR